MKRLGFSFDVRKKSYYVDSHETKENVEYRTEFIAKYFAYELLAHRWYSISEAKRDEMRASKELSSEIGYKYEKDGMVFFEYHVDDHPTFQHACNDLPFGGHLSVRKPKDKKK